MVAFRRGTLVDTIDHGRTGFLVESEAEMADAMRAAGGLDADFCRRTAIERFSATHMAAQYLDLYARLAGARPAHAVEVAAP